MISYETSYNRVGLKFNPFFFLSSEAIQSSLPFKIEDIHVFLPIDHKIVSVIKETFNRKGKKLIFLTGLFGLGKTERAKLLKEFLEKNNFATIYIKIDTSNPKVLVQSILNKLVDKYNDLYKLPIIGKFKKNKMTKEITIENLISSPREIMLNLKWLLSRLRPFIMVMDELENVFHAHIDEQRFFFSFLLSLYRIMPLESMLIITCIPSALNLIQTLTEDLYSEVADIIELTPLTDSESIKLAQKRIELARTENFDMQNPLHPFTKEAVVYANRAAEGNARNLIKILRTALAALIVNPNIEIIDEKFMRIVVEQSGKADGELKKQERKKRAVPENLLKDLRMIMEEFEGGPVSYLFLARKTRTPAILQLRKLRELREKGFLEEEAGKFWISEEAKKILEEK